MRSIPNMISGASERVSASITTGHDWCRILADRVKTIRSRAITIVRRAGGGVLPRLKHPGALLHWISGRRRHPATLFAGRFRGMVRGLSRRAMVYVRCAQQCTSEWQGVTGPGAGCRRCSDHNNVPPQYPLKFSGRDGRNSGRAGMTVLLVFEQEARARSRGRFACNREKAGVPPSQLVSTGVKSTGKAWGGAEETPRPP